MSLRSLSPLLLLVSTLVAPAAAPAAKPSDAELRKRLTPMQYHVTQEAGTERPFANEYWDNHAAGVYVDVVSGEPLFSSLDKFDSGTGWPSFTKPLVPENIVEREDRGFFTTRTEVRSAGADSHLGHVFDDGPAPTHLRYCMNSAALRFVPADKLAAEGLGAFAPAFGLPAAAAPEGASAATGATGSGDAAPAPGSRETATLAGGCFWGMQEILRKIPGVISTRVGYTGGTLPHPTYDDVHEGTTGHAEAVEIVFDPSVISFRDLLEKWFFRLHDPTTEDRQGNDRGSQYRSAIFVHSAQQRADALAAKKAAQAKWPDPIVTEIVKAGPFWPAEDYHQDYLQKNPGGYTCHYLRP